MNNLKISLPIVFLLASAGALADESCSAVSLYNDHGEFESCQVMNGDRISFLDASDTTEEACASTCAAMAEINAMAAESRELDSEAGF